MKRYPGIDYTQRPRSYFEYESPNRQSARAYAALIARAQEGEARLRLDVEIVHIELASTLGDVINLRATPVRGRIAYHAYGENGEVFRLSRKSSREPLTLAGVIDLLDNSTCEDLPGGLALGFNEMNAGSNGRQELRHFTTISSDFYPQLNEHYERVFDDWCNAETGTDAAEEGVKLRAAEAHVPSEPTWDLVKHGCSTHQLRRNGKGVILVGGSRKQAEATLRSYRDQERTARVALATSDPLALCRIGWHGRRLQSELQKPLGRPSTWFRFGAKIGEAGGTMVYRVASEPFEYLAQTIKCLGSTTPWRCDVCGRDVDGGGDLTPTQTM